MCKRIQNMSSRGRQSFNLLLDQYWDRVTCSLIVINKYINKYKIQSLEYSCNWRTNLVYMVSGAAVKAMHGETLDFPCQHKQM